LSPTSNKLKPPRGFLDSPMKNAGDLVRSAGETAPF
jgi:hypothetical protein